MYMYNVLRRQAVSLNVLENLSLVQSFDFPAVDMRLLNVRTLEFHEFTAENRPPYVITSHRWIGEEITYQHFRDRERIPGITETAGYKKVSSFCQFLCEWGKDVSCPSRDSAVPNVRGDCGKCFSRKYQCDKAKPKCSNCQHDGLTCEYDFAVKAEPVESTPPTVQQNQEPSHLSDKSCMACATANRVCSKEHPACMRCIRYNLPCDYGTALSSDTLSSTERQYVSGIEWIWIDTCCIDKSSSAELNEVINSMFRYYADAYACLAYIQDVRSCHHAPSTVLLDFQKSSWFTRGWTLQELLAPKLVVFLNRNWEVSGHKAGPIQTSIQMSVSKIQMPLNPWIARITGIPESVLLDYYTMRNISVERRLEWMAGRTTTRVEDRAYCLLGICDVFLPLIYGEGERAFDRLEETLNKESADLAVPKLHGLRSRLMSSTGRVDLATTSKLLDVLDHPVRASSPTSDRSQGSGRTYIPAPSAPLSQGDQKSSAHSWFDLDEPTSSNARARYPRRTRRERDSRAFTDLLGGRSRSDGRYLPDVEADRLQDSVSVDLDAARSKQRVRIASRAQDRYYPATDRSPSRRYTPHRTRSSNYHDWENVAIVRERPRNRDDSDSWSNRRALPDVADHDGDTRLESGELTTSRRSSGGGLRRSHREEKLDHLQLSVNHLMELYIGLKAKIEPSDNGAEAAKDSMSHVTLPRSVQSQPSSHERFGTPSVESTPLVAETDQGGYRWVLEAISPNIEEVGSHPHHVKSDVQQPRWTPRFGPRMPSGAPHAQYLQGHTIRRINLTSSRGSGRGRHLDKPLLTTRWTFHRP